MGEYASASETGTTTIHSNGSRWAGQEPATVEALLALLKVEPLDPTFEKYGNFVGMNPDGAVWVWGNFARVSHVFNIVTTDATVQNRLISAIRSNQATDAYQNARREH